MPVSKERQYKQIRSNLRAANDMVQEQELSEITLQTLRNAAIQAQEGANAVFQLIGQIDGERNQS